MDNKEIKLSKRLFEVVKYIGNGKKIADVGTDHGYIPVYLALRGDMESIIASDVNRGPLEKARHSAEEYGVSDKIRFFLSDGLSDVPTESADTVIIAGMGGETIEKILSGAPWTKNGVRLILQPQSKIPQLRMWLSENGYAVDDCSLVKEDGKFYTVFSVSGGQKPKIMSETELLVSEKLFQNKDRLLGEYLERLIRKYRYIIAGLEKTESPLRAEEREHYEILVKKLKAEKEETEKWLL